MTTASGPENVSTPPNAAKVQHFTDSVEKVGAGLTKLNEAANNAAKKVANAAPKDEKSIPTRNVIVVDGVQYDDIVPKNYKIDNEHEVILYGDELEDDMVVLTEGQRRDETDPQNSPDLLIRNRWCVVKRIRFEESGIYFIAQYADGEMVVRQSAPASGWIVKKSSIPEPQEQQPPAPGTLGHTIAKGLGKLSIEAHPQPKTIVPVNVGDKTAFIETD